MEVRSRMLPRIVLGTLVLFVHSNLEVVQSLSKTNINRETFPNRYISVRLLNRKDMGMLTFRRFYLVWIKVGHADKHDWLKHRSGSLGLDAEVT
jgi:hypothetical protein